MMMMIYDDDDDLFRHHLQNENNKNKYVKAMCAFGRLSQTVMSVLEILCLFAFNFTADIKEYIRREEVISLGSFSVVTRCF